jgi:GT2 family glycosyltransferase
VHDRPKLLVEAVASALEQSHRPLEVLIVDDGSTDDTGRVAEELARGHAEVVTLHQPNGGPGRAREAGRLRARGEFIQHLDSDDLLLPGKLEAQVAALRVRADCGVAYGFTQYREADGRLRPERWKPTGHAAEFLFPSFLRERWWETVTPLYRASVCDAVGPWSELRLEEDWEYDCRVAALGVRLHCVSRFVAEHRHHALGRLSGGAHAAWRLRERARAHELILGHARRAGVDPRGPEMRHFARELFLLARQCGALRLPDESRRLFELARGASGERGRALDFVLYRALAASVGWRAAGRCAAWLDRLRGRRGGRS